MRFKRLRSGTPALLTLGLSMLAGGNGVPAGAADAAAELTSLESVDQFKALYNEKAGVPRLILLLSPT